jgi:peroxiredoxin Q/BCP
MLRTRSATLALATAFLLLAAPAAAQQPAATPLPDNGPKVGDMAPDFTLPAGRDGVGTSARSRSRACGQTVVIAFFPRSRTAGCTAQMKAYRDQYATLFNEGKGVTVLAVSTDSASVQATGPGEGFRHLRQRRERRHRHVVRRRWSTQRAKFMRRSYVVGPTAGSST